MSNNKKPKVSEHCEALAAKLHDWWKEAGYTEFPATEALEARIKAYFLDNDLVVIKRQTALSLMLPGEEF